MLNHALLIYLEGQDYFYKITDSYHGKTHSDQQQQKNETKNNYINKQTKKTPSNFSMLLCEFN